MKRNTNEGLGGSYGRGTECSLISIGKSWISQLFEKPLSVYMPWSQLWALTLVSSTQLHEPPHRSPLLGSPSCLTPFLLSCQWPPWNIHYNFILCFCYSAFLCLLRFPCRICARGWNPRALGYRHTFVFSVSKVMWEPGGQNERYQVHKEGAGTEGERCSVSGGVVGGRLSGSVSKKNTARTHCLAHSSRYLLSMYIMAFTGERNILSRILLKFWLVLR